jgi:hypothetical protein
MHNEARCSAERTVCSCAVSPTSLHLLTRRKKEEEKLKSARYLALQAEQRRWLERAKDFRARQLLVRRGLAPWRRYIQRAQDMQDRAVHFHAAKLAARIWHAYRGYVASMRAERVRTEYRLAAQASSHYK